jgi:hypothetical protein
MTVSHAATIREPFLAGPDTVATRNQAPRGLSARLTARGSGEIAPGHLG